MLVSVAQLIDSVCVTALLALVVIIDWVVTWLLDVAVSGTRRTEMGVNASSRVIFWQWSSDVCKLPDCSETWLARYRRYSTMAKLFDFQWQISVPDSLLQGGRFDRWEEVSSHTSLSTVCAWHFIFWRTPKNLPISNGWAEIKRNLNKSYLVSDINVNIW